MNTVESPRPEIAECMEQYDPDHAHALQVCRLSLALFDELTALHGLGERERGYLRDAAFLHDTGWCDGRKGHHKRSMEIILSAPTLPFGDRERRIIANVARYHRRAFPQPDHAAFASLDNEAQEIVEKLSALLRIADGLDVTHRSVVHTVHCAAGDDGVRIMYTAAAPAPAEEAQALKKSSLFTHVYKESIVIQWMPRL